MAQSQTTDLHELAERHYLWPLLHDEDREREPPLILSEGSGARLRDVDGMEYVDLMSTTTRAATLGFSRDDVAGAMQRQQERLPYAGTAWEAADVTIELAAELAERTPGDLVSVAFAGSGSEANESAMRMARAYQHAEAKPRAYKVISRWNAYHGSVGSALAASDLLDVRHQGEPGVPGVSHIPAPTCYRCPFSLEYPSCNLQCAEYLEREIEHQGPELVSAFIAEPVMQANGVQVPPPDYLPRVAEICHDHDVVFIADEVITGLGRTGKLFASEHWGLEPDMMTLAKGLTAGYAPLGATVISGRIRSAVTRLADVHTFGGHATSAAAALEVLRILDAEALPERARDLGSRLLERLDAFRTYEIVGDVRGLGMWMAVDFTSDRTTKSPLSREALTEIVMSARKEGVIVNRNGTAIEIAPPLTIAEDEALEAIDGFERAVASVDRQHRR